MTRNSVENYKYCAAKGMTPQQTANTLGVDRATVTIMAKRHNITFAPDRHGRPAGTSAPIGLTIVKALAEPKTTVQLAKEVGITTQTIKNHLKYLSQNGFVRFVGSAGRTTLWAKGKGF